jgi:hypothetical protein
MNRKNNYSRRSFFWECKHWKNPNNAINVMGFFKTIHYLNYATAIDEEQFAIFILNKMLSKTYMLYKLVCSLSYLACQITYHTISHVLRRLFAITVSNTVKSTNCMTMQEVMITGKCTLITMIQSYVIHVGTCETVNCNNFKSLDINRLSHDATDSADISV